MAKQLILNPSQLERGFLESLNFVGSNTSEWLCGLWWIRLLQVFRQHRSPLCNQSNPSIFEIHSDSYWLVCIYWFEIDILFSVDGGDPDLYAIFANHSEPGQYNFDYKSSSYSSVTDSIEVSYGMPHYCLNCIVYLSVYGFSKSSYTIQATSTGLTQLQADAAIGGSIRQDKYYYYTFYNSLQFAEMRISLTTVSSS